LVFDLPGQHPYAPVWRWQQQRVREKVTAERAITKAARTTVHVATTTLQSPLLVHSVVHELQEASDVPVVRDLNNESSAATNPETELLRSGLADVLLLLEHAPVYTLGRNASLSHLRFPPHVRVRVAERGELTSSMPAAAEAAAAGQVPPIDDAVDFELLRVERGGEVTFHGPGQLMIYPLLSLNPSPIVDPVALASGGLSQQAGVSPFRPDLHWFLRSLESVVIRFLRLYDVQGERLPGASGVWVRLEEPDASGVKDAAPCVNGAMAAAAASGLHKIAALGLSCSGWVSMHGCALNLDCPLQRFDFIVPCGLEDRSKFAGVTSLQQVLQRRQDRLLLNPTTMTNGATRARGTGQKEVVRLDHARIRQQIMQCFREEFQLPEPMAICTQLPDS
jgi:lipoate-protein ligase B